MLAGISTLFGPSAAKKTHHTFNGKRTPVTNTGAIGHDSLDFSERELVILGEGVGTIIKVGKRT